MLAVLIAALLALAPAPPSAPPGGRAPPSVGRATGFATVVLDHVERTIGLDRLPPARGVGVRAGMFVTLGLDRMWVFDREVTRLQAGQVPDTTVAGACVSRCPAVLFDVFQAEWLLLAVESASMAVEIPEQVMFAVDGRVPAHTLLQAAYAVAESRPVQPPAFSLLVDSPGRGLQGQPFFVLPPKVSTSSKGRPRWV